MKNISLKLICSILCLTLLCACTANGQAIASPESTASAEMKEEMVNVSLEAGDQWDSSQMHYTKYNLSIISQSSKEITDWTIDLNSSEQNLDQSWNCLLKQDTENWQLTPMAYNQNISAGSSLTDIGIIACSASTQQLTFVSADITFADGSTMHINADYKEASATPSVQPTSAAGTAEGMLHVSGTHLVNSDNETVQLKGVSTHGLAWYPQYVNEDAFRTLRDDWHANVVRLAMYTEESGGYCSDGSQDQLKQTIDTGVKAASDLGMYVIIDWHILSDGNPMQNQAQAESFFAEMSKKYADNDNVLYEICNEPQNSPWSSVIRPYAEDIIPIIRANSPHAIIIVGTNTWSQDVDDVISDPLSDQNVVYALHFYAGTHKDDLRQKLTKAVNAGIPVFVSECSICDASGSGGIDTASAQQWLDLLNANQISYLAWSLSNKAETSALIQPSCTKTSGWSKDDLSDTGKWFYHAISGK